MYKRRHDKDTPLTIITIMHNGNVPPLCVSLCFLSVSRCYRNNNYIGMRSCWNDQCRRTVYATSFLALNPFPCSSARRQGAQFADKRTMTYAIFAAPNMPKRSASAFFATGLRPAAHSPNSARELSQSTNGIMIGVKFTRLTDMTVD